MPRIIRFKTQKISRHQFRRNYRDYIKSEEWFLKREQAFMFHGRFCKKCKKTDGLHVHHMTYIRLKNELMSDLCILCTLCHKDYHKINRHTSIESTEAFLTLTGDVDPKNKPKRTKKARYSRISNFDRINIAISNRKRSSAMSAKIRSEWAEIAENEKKKPDLFDGLLSLNEIEAHKKKMMIDGKL